MKVKTKPIAITHQAYIVAVAEKNERIEKGIPSTICGVVSEIVIREFGKKKNNG